MITHNVNSPLSNHLPTIFLSLWQIHTHWYFSLSLATAVLMSLYPPSLRHGFAAYRIKHTSWRVARISCDGKNKDAEWGTEEQGVGRNSLLMLGVYFSDEIRNSLSCERNYAFPGFIGIWRLSGFQNPRDYILRTKAVQRLALLNAKLRTLRISVLRLTDAQFACTVINCFMWTDDTGLPYALERQRCQFSAVVSLKYSWYV
jgi:hypothetical protein